MKIEVLETKQNSDEKFLQRKYFSLTVEEVSQLLAKWVGESSSKSVIFSIEKTGSIFNVFINSLDHELISMNSYPISGLEHCFNELEEHAEIEFVISDRDNAFYLKSGDQIACMDSFILG